MRLDSSFANVSKQSPNMEDSRAILHYSNRTAWAEKQDLGWNACANWQRILFLSIYQIHWMQKIKILGLCSPEILALMPKDTNMKLFTAVSFVIAKNGKRSKYLPTVSGSINPGRGIPRIAPLAIRRG